MGIKNNLGQWGRRAALALFGLASAVHGPSACGGSDSGIIAAQTTTLAVGESRTIELRFLRFDVTNFQQTLTKKDILALPVDIRERLWLLDLDLAGGPQTPRLLDNAMAAIRRADPSTLSLAARNFQRLLNMTPDSADLRGTALERLIDLAPLLGVASPRVLADMLKVDVEDTFLSSAVISQAVLRGVIGTHPNALTRLGPRTKENPSGLYPVASGKLPVTLTDAASDFASLAERFGEYSQGGVYHPGFITGNVRAKVLTDDFKLTVRANANALPFKGVDLTSATTASVNSIPSQIRDMFDFKDPNWLTLEGLVAGTAVIESMTFRVVESDRFIRGGLSPAPTGMGSSTAWQLPPWMLERVVMDASRESFGKVDTTLAYGAPGKPPLFRASVVKGWQEIFVEGGIGAPPPPNYLWDLLLEVAQVRLHDGGIKEGEGNIEFELRDIPTGTDTDTITQSIRENLEANPTSLLDVARRLIDTSSGDADYYYMRTSARTVLPEQVGDWLFFVTEGDIPMGADGKPKRAYRYSNPGFFADEALTQKVSSKVLLDGDTEHEKVMVGDGDTLYVQDDEGAVYRLKVGVKASLNLRQFTITRVR